jgi:tetratricopeptide (TPR) repeat protein
VLIGRDGETAAIERWVELGLSEDQPRFLTIVGRPGVGRSALLRSVGDHARLRGWSVTEAFTAERPAVTIDVTGPDGTASFGPGTVATRLRTDSPPIHIDRDERGPRLILVDDAHLVPLDRLAQLIDAPPNASHSTVVIATWSSDAGPLTDVLRERSDRLDLHPLDDRSARQLLGHRLDTISHQTDSELADPLTFDANTVTNEVIAVAAGLPRLLVLGSLSLMGDRADRREPISAPIVRERLRPLTSDAMQILATASLLGDIVSPDLIATGLDASPTSIIGALDEAVELGLLVEHDAVGGEPTQWRFAHHAIREVCARALPSSDRQAVHRAALRAATQLTNPTPADLRRIADHALAAGPLLRLDERSDACRAVAHALSSDSPREARAWLDRAVALHEQASVDAPAGLLVEWAEATLESGQLAEARPRFWRASDAAHDDHDVTMRSRAALGLGGIWVHEHRDPVLHERYLGLVDDSIAAEPDPIRADSLRARRLAEELYRGSGTATELDSVVDRLRQRGGGRMLARALSLQHHTKLGPANAHQRLTLAQEQLSVAARCRDSLSEVMAVLWMTIDLTLLGDPTARRWHDDLRQRADRLDMPAIGFVAQCLDVMELLRAGKFSEAEELAGACAAVGAAAGDADATAFFGAHLLNSRWMQGTASDLIPALDQLAGESSLVTTQHLYASISALLSAESGDIVSARRQLTHLDALDGSGLAEAEQASSIALVALMCQSSTAAVLDDRDRGSQLYRRLLPYVNLPTMASLAVACFGSTHYGAAMASRAAGHEDLAARHFELAIEANQQLGNRPAEALATAELAESLDRLGHANDASRRRRDAISLASGMDMTARVERWLSIRPRRPVECAAELTARPDGWEFRVDDRSIVVPTSTGMGYIAQLIERAPHPVNVDDLTGGTVKTSAHEIVDAETIRRYRRHLTDLEREIADADADADLERAASLRIEFDTVLTTIQRDLRLDGSSRRFADSTERARSAVQKAIRRAIDRVTETDAELGQALRASVMTGYECRFEPVRPLPHHWVVHRHQS